VFQSVSLATLLLTILIYLADLDQISRLVVLATWGLNIPTLLTWRFFKRRVIERRVCQGHGARNVLIVGAGKVGRKLAHVLDQNKQLGLLVKGFLDDRQDGEHVLGAIKDLERILPRYFIDEVIITLPSERDLVKEISLKARRHRASVKVIPELYDGEGLWGRPSLELVGDLPILELYQEPIPELGLLVKRLLDLAGAVLGLLLALPLMTVIALAIKIDSPRGPLIYRSRRVGRKGEIFDCYKFRTMVPDADELKATLQDFNEREGPFFKITHDPRVTRVGRFLRKYSLDEIPQFWNVLKGEMSLVGPRPPTTDEVDRYERYKIEYYRRLDVKPGLTSLWAIQAQQDPSFEKAVQLDLYYIENWSLWLDAQILLNTIPTVLKGVGR
jgi:exopolysaccharide biosynthesis polyprenyl glycosylphosphotransferase